MIREKKGIQMFLKVIWNLNNSNQTLLKKLLVYLKCLD